MKKILILLISLFVLLGIIIFNLRVYSLYYAIHSEYSSEDEVPGLVLEHLDDVMMDFRTEYFGDYFLQVDGSSSIVYRMGKDDERSFDEETSSLSDYYYTKSENNKVFIYGLDKKLLITDTTILGDDLDKPIVYKVSPKEQDQVREDINNLVKPLLKRVNEPIINLQWLYDLIFMEH
ncbi:hypothetical protein [Streptococcus hyovaginalis]|uniref:hypothetical protein n=1 Tax=Streptococcus hyovaginalis TaxID=149015 RepID=UPI003AC943BA